MKEYPDYKYKPRKKPKKGADGQNAVASSCNQVPGQLARQTGIVPSTVASGRPKTQKR